jgi:hypothetical protein
VSRPKATRWSKGTLENAAETSEPPVTMPSSAGLKYFGAVDFISSEVHGVISDILIITRSRLRPGAEIGLHRVDELVGIVEHEGQEPIDAVASHGDAGRLFCNERLPLPLEDGPQGSSPATTEPSTRSFVMLNRPSCTHCLTDQNCLLSSLLSAIR